MQVLVTGITGRIEANLAAALVGQGHAVRGLVWGRDARVDKLRPLGVELIEGSLTEPADVARAVDGVDAIYHLGAAFQGGGPFSTTDYFEINVRGAFLMLEAVPYLSERLGIPHVEGISNGMPTDYAFDLDKARRLIDFRPQYDIRRMIDDALAFERGEDIGVLPTG